jgi:hypothetical protein
MSSFTVHAQVKVGKGIHEDEERFHIENIGTTVQLTNPTTGETSYYRVNILKKNPDGSWRQLTDFSANELDSLANRVQSYVNQFDATEFFNNPAEVKAMKFIFQRQRPEDESAVPFKLIEAKIKRDGDPDFIELGSNVYSNAQTQLGDVTAYLGLIENQRLERVRRSPPEADSPPVERKNKKHRLLPLEETDAPRNNRQVPKRVMSFTEGMGRSQSFNELDSE